MFYYAANWKLNKSPQEAYQFIKKLRESLAVDQLEQCLIFPSAFSLVSAIEAKSVTPLKLGAQNVYWQDDGAFTGENSPKILKDMGVTHCLVGHSERRHLFAETDEDVNKKVLQLQKNNICPVICVGEDIHQRKEGSTKAVITSQLKQAIKGADYKKEFLIAYEPVWAIGTGEVASPEQAEEAHKFLREELGKIAGLSVAKNTSILYGGSVKPTNSSDIKKQENVNGFLIGGASLELESYLQIVSNT